MWEDFSGPGFKTTVELSLRPPRRAKQNPGLHTCTPWYYFNSNYKPM